MNKEEPRIKVKIEYKNDMEARNKLLEHLIDCLMKIKKKAGDEDGKEW